jgi:hypothetical protein
MKLTRSENSSHGAWSNQQKQTSLMNKEKYLTRNKKKLEIGEIGYVINWVQVGLDLPQNSIF